MPASGNTSIDVCFTDSGKVADVLTFSWWENSQSISDNTTNVGWKLELISYNYGYIQSSVQKSWAVTVNGENYGGTNTVGISSNSSKVLASGSTVIKHNDDGTKNFSYSFSQTFDINFNGWVGTKSASGNGTLTTIARASQPSCITYPNHTQNVGSFGDTISIHMNRAGSDFDHAVYYSFGSVSWQFIAANVGTGLTWTIPVSLMNQLPSTTQGSGTIYVETYYKGKYVGTKWCGFTATVPASVKPTCTATLEDTTGNDDIYGSPVQGLSKIKVTVNPTLAYSSPIKSYSISINGLNYSTTPITTGFLTKSGTSTVTVTVTDSRGRSGSWSYNMNVQAYTPPAVTKLIANRCNSDGTPNKRGDYVKVTFSAKVSAMGNKNTVSYKLKYKKTTEAESANTTVNLTALTNNYTPTDQTYIFAAIKSKSYDVVVEAVDRHNSNNPAFKATKAPTALSIFSWRGFRTSAGIEEGAGIGKIPEKPNTLQVGWETEFDKAVRGQVWGLGLLDILPDNSDINHILTPGVYSIAFNASAGTMKNLPRQLAGRLIVSESTGIVAQYKEQLFLPYDIGWATNIPWVRHAYRNNTGLWEYSNWCSFALFSYPVGSLYIAYNHTNPGTLFGGTWERVENAFLWACDASGTIGQTGGEKTHTLTVDELPSHSHGSVYSQHATGTKDKAWYTTSGSSVAYGTVATGGGQAHNNMPPYIQVSVWRRTA